MRFLTLSICLLHLNISASNKDSFPLQSGICKYVSIKLKGVNLNSSEHEIPNVWDNSILIATVFINVDFPAAFGPVIKIFLTFFDNLLLFFFGLLFY